MKKLAEFITKHKNIIILLAVILLIPSGIGYVSTRVNYDILSYLPDSLETVKGQDVMVVDEGCGSPGEEDRGDRSCGGCPLV